jgi:predicted ester cyclase
MTTAENKAIVRRFYKAFEADDQTTLKELLAPDLAAYSYGGGPQNRAAHLSQIGGWNAMFSDTRFEIAEQIAEGDLVATRVTMYSTHSRADYQGVPPTGKQVVIPAVSLERIRGGQITERRVNADWLTMLQQLGLIPPPPPTK